MARLSVEQLKFLEQQRVSLARVFDATGLSKAAYRDVMNELDMIVAFGVSPCRLQGHTLRTRAGHCVQCNTATLAFILRFEQSGTVYVARSPKTKLLKIGVAKNHLNRLQTLNEQGYGGISDWQIVFHSVCKSAGRVEFEAQNALGRYRVSRSFTRSARIVECQELFSCKASVATNAVRAAERKNGL